MQQHLKSLAPLVLVFVLAFGSGYILPRQAQGDMMHAVAAVQRHSPWFLISEPVPMANWARSGSIYLCRTSRTAAEMEDLPKDPRKADARWDGVLCFKGTVDPGRVQDPWVFEGGDRCLRYDVFAVFGDRDALAKVRVILAAEGFHSVE